MYILIKNIYLIGYLKPYEKNVRIMEPGLLQEVLKKAAKKDMEN